VRNLANRLEADARRQRREATYASLQRAYAQPTLPADSCDDDKTRDLIVAVGASNTERTALTAWLEGERRTAPLALALGLTDLSPLAQRQEVKRFKDRLRRRLKRLLPIVRDRGRAIETAQVAVCDTSRNTAVNEMSD
jgi:hypothetical protein